MKLKSNVEKAKINSEIFFTNRYLTKYPNFNFDKIKGVNISLKCEKCNIFYTINRSTFRVRVLNSVNPCICCNPINDHTSLTQKEIVGFVRSIYDKEVLINDRKILSPKEIDIFIPEKNVGIELHGLYWHSEIYVNNDYHQSKFLISENKNINLIQIFDDEWINKKEIVKSIVSSKLNIYNTIIFGRKCLIKEILSKDCNKFLDENHIQGKVNSKIKLGLFYNNELVSVMTFGSYRKSLGTTKKDNEWEMLRFCNKLNTKILGGASKLFNFFIKNYNPIKIISYSDNRFFNGEIYKTLGFNFSHISKPNYFYTKDFKLRESRFKYRKDVLVDNGEDSDLTEQKIMAKNGYYRVYDAGNKKWNFTLV